MKKRSWARAGEISLNFSKSFHSALNQSSTFINGHAAGEHCNLPRPYPYPLPPCIHCTNLIRNPSFESNSSYWWTDNVSITDFNVFEGNTVANMGPGVASLSQDFPLQGANCHPLFFSFNAFAGFENEFNGELIVEVLWLNSEYNQIRPGLRMFIPNGRINYNARITFFAITDQVPANAAHARVIFSKGPGIFPDFILIDQVVLATISGHELMINGDFETGLLGWTADPETAFISNYELPLEGAGHVCTHFDGTLTQDVYMCGLPPCATFLFSFTAAGSGLVSLNVRIEWLDFNYNPIGSGLTLEIPDETLSAQGNYLSYLNITEPAPPCTAFARIIFTAAIPDPGCYLLLDQVLFARVETDNLILNPSFEDGLDNWESVNYNLVELNDVYEGTTDLGLGEIGGALWQEVELCHAAGHCYLFSTGLGFRYTNSEATFGTMLMKVIWLDHCGHEIGLGLYLTGTSSNQTGINPHWVPYVGITESAPPGTAKARIQFTKTSSEDGYIEIDNVVFGRLI
ncbi:MAG: hypothetical protein H6Q64_866 [Firmicutes bacterium]|nr:hypothetical protein [Bacillota bacterium]